MTHSRPTPDTAPTSSGIARAAAARLLSAMVLLLPVAATSSAHPGVGIVRDGRGNIYYTDLDRVWKIAPDGSKSVAVPDVHTHELYLDPEGNLYGEHLWYEGEATDRWGHRIWKLTPGGSVVEVIAARHGFREDYDDFSFVRDGTGAMYWALRGDTTAIRMRPPGGETRTLARHPFRDVRWMTATPGGTVFLADLQDIVRISPDGSVATIAPAVADRGPGIRDGSDRHAVMGLWTDSAGNLYAAVASDRSVKRIAPDGRVDVVTTSGLLWAPSGGLVAPDGTLYVLEYSLTNSVRVVRVDVSGRRRVVS